MDEAKIGGGENLEAVVPAKLLQRFEERLKNLENNYSKTPQLHGVISQIVELAKSNQKIIDEVIKANSDLRGELSRLPPKMEELIVEMKGLMSLIKMAGEGEYLFSSADVMKPVEEQLKKMVDQNQKLVESNQEVLSSLEDLNKKIKTGTPITQLLSTYPRIRIKSLENYRF